MYFYTACQISFIKKNYKLSAPELAKRFNRKFRKKKTGQNLRSLGKRLGYKVGRDTRFKRGDKTWNAGTKGLTSANKTSFKTGQMPHNWCPVGTERLTFKENYIKVKIKEPNIWKFKHLLIWEEKYGPVPAGMVVIFKDNDRQKCKLRNLAMVSRRVLLRLNQNGYANLPASLKPSAKALAELEVKTFSLM